MVGAANIQLATCSPNFLILEGIERWDGFHGAILKKPIRWEDGFVIPPEDAGLGVELNEEVALTHPEMVSHAILVATSTKGVDNVALRDYVLKEPVEGSWKKALEAKGKTYPADFYNMTPLDAEGCVNFARQVPSVR